MQIDLKSCAYDIYIQTQNESTCECVKILKSPLWMSSGLTPLYDYKDVSLRFGYAASQI